MQACGMLGNFVAEDKPEVHTIVDWMSDPQWDVLFFLFVTEVGSIGKD